MRNRFGSARQPGSHWQWVLWLTLVIEVVTCLLRFGGGLESTVDTAFVAPLTLGWRIHHSYIGLLLALVARAWPRGHLLRCWGARLGWALLASDLVHHFLVLWPITGSPHFDLRYPGI